MSRLKSVAAGLCTLTLVPALSGCEPLQPLFNAFGPTPDAALVTLARDAEADAASRTLAADPDKAAGRMDHAAALYAEIERICGTDADGNAPESCAVERGEFTPLPDDATTADVYKDSRAQLLDALDQVPESSRTLIVEQAIDLAAASFSPADFTATPNLGEEGVAPADIEAAKKLLDWEYSVIYALDVTEAFAGGGTQAQVEEALGRHERRVAKLSDALESAGEVPAPAPAYEASGAPLPSSGKQAAGYLAYLDKEDAAQWEHAAVNAESAAWRDWAVVVAGTSRARLN